MDPTEEDILVLKMALDDEKVSIRRLAAAYLGMVKGDGVLPLLYKALLDRSVSVLPYSRRLLVRRRGSSSDVRYD